MKKLIYSLSIILFATLLWQGCEKDELPGSIYGTVVDKATGEPIKSAGVELSPGGLKTVTGSEGQFEFTQLTPGNYTLLITKAGYVDFATSMVNVLSNETAKCDVQIEKLPQALVILDDDGNEVEVLDFGSSPVEIMRSFYIFNKGDETLEWSILYSCPWINSISKESGEVKSNTKQPLVVKIDRNELNVGKNTTSIHVISNNGTRKIDVFAYSNIILETLEATEIRAGSAVLNGKITENMSPSISKYGFVYSKKAAPTIQNGATMVVLSGSPTIGTSYSSLVSNLDKETFYYARAFVSNGVDTIYGGQISFKTIEGLPIVKTLGSYNVTSSSAIIQCEVIEDAGETIIKRGVCYGTSPLPSVQGVHTSDGTGLGKWESSLINLSPNMTYYVRAYATNSFGTSYGEQLTIQTLEGLAIVRTGEVSSITSNTAKCSGEVVSDGDREVTKRGICWKNEAYPTINDSYLISGAGIGSFSCELTGLEPGVMYHVRSYATNSAGTVYGEDVSFSTLVAIPKVSIVSINNVTSSSAYIRGTLTSTGGATITEIGFSYKAEDDYYFEEVNTQVTNGSFSVQLTNLEPNTNYYIRAYATNSQGTGVSELMNFTTESGLPEISTVSSSNVGSVKATVTGEISSDGGFSIRECGICYSSTNKTPSLNDSYVKNTTTQIGQYTCEITGLEPSTKYYACAYAKNSNGTVYGSPINFNTTNGVPSIAILQSPTYEGNNATLYGKILSDGGVDIEYYGVVFGKTNAMPSLENKDAITYGEGNPLSSTITFNVLNIPSNAMLYYRFFVVNALAEVAYSSVGYIYGDLYR